MSLLQKQSDMDIWLALLDGTLVAADFYAHCNKCQVLPSFIGGVSSRFRESSHTQVRLLYTTNATYTRMSLRSYCPSQLEAFDAACALHALRSAK